MTTAIAVYTSEGCVGRCDARCHEASKTDCDCVCGGRLHGCGRDNAIAQNTEWLLGDALVQAKSWAGLQGFDVDRIDVPLKQGVLL